MICPTACMDERLIYYTSILLLGIASQWLAWRLRLPSKFLLLAVGFTAGQFYDQSQVVEQDTLFVLVSLAVAVILLEGGSRFDSPSWRRQARP